MTACLGYPLFVVCSDQVNLQHFRVICNREVNTTTGDIEASIGWTIEPPDLPYSTFDESLLELDIAVRIVTLTQEGNITAPRLPVLTTLTRDHVGEGVTINDALVSFDRNASGSVTYKVSPAADLLMDNALQFDVSCYGANQGGGKFTPPQTKEPRPSPHTHTYVHTHTHTHTHAKKR